MGGAFDGRRDKRVDVPGFGTAAAVGPGDYLEPVTVRVLEVDAAPVIPGVELVRARGA